MAKKLLNNQDDYAKACHNLRNKYFNLYRSNYEWTGLDYRQEEYVMKELWAKGTVAAFKIKNIDELGFAPWARITWDMYGLPETVSLINTYGSPVVPMDPQIVDKDVVLGYLQSNKKPLSEIVEWYVERIAQAEMVINTNLQLQKMPFLIPVEDEQEAKKVQDIIDRILDNEIVITATGIDPTIFKAVQTQSNYIIDKLVNYKIGLENELKTIIGIDNKGQEKIEQLQLSEVNANNAEINSFNTDYETCLNRFCEQMGEVLGKTVSVKTKRAEVEADGQYHNMTEQPGPKESDEE